jgi:hypothetical protein
VVNVVALGLAVVGCAAAGLPGAAGTAVAIEATFAALALLAMQRIQPRG